MTKEMVISANRHETKVAILENDQLVEIYFQRSNEYSLVGSIHKGRVTRVLPGMQSAFVELGLERDAFLYVSDFLEQNDEDYERVSTRPESRDRGTREPRESREPRETREPRESREPREAREPREVREVAAPKEGEPAAEGAAEPAAEAAPQADGRNDRDRRGRGRRRRRRGGRGGNGIPESKYASASAVESEAADTEGPGEDAGGEEEPLILPGESIAKYGAASAESIDDVDAEPEAEALASGVQEPVEEESAEEVVAEANDDIRDEVQELVNESLADEAELAHERALAATEDGSMDLAPEDGAEADEAASEPGEGGEPIQAEVREQPVARYIQRGHRRMRRRGRGGDRYEAVPRTAPGQEQPAQQAARPEREQRDGREGRGRDRGERPPQQSISELLKEGQEIIVQIAKEPLGQKGARITSHIAMPGRYVVFMPTLDHLGVSRKVGGDDERQRLKRIVQTHAQGISGGFIVRTAGEGKSEADIATDMNFLNSQWLDIRKKAEKRHAPCLLHSDLELVTRTLRDQVGDQFRAIWCDNEEIFEGVVGFLERFQPEMVGRVKMYGRDTPIFDTFNVTAELEKALRPKVWLKSGGYIVINQTEALVAIDINTGKFVGKSNRLEDTIVKTNIEAIKEIVRQVRLRDLGGIIVVDFIDMDERKNRQKVMQALEEAMRTDRAPYKILQFNDFGLVAITRRRVKQSLERALCAPCPTCEGAGYVKSPQTIVGEVITEAHKIAPALEGKDVMLRVNPEVAKALKAGNYLPELEEVLGKTVIVKSDDLLHPEKFDLA